MSRFDKEGLSSEGHLLQLPDSSFFRALLRRRMKLRLGLSVMLLGAFFGAVITAALAPAIFDGKIFGMPPAVVMTLAVIVLTVLLTGYYAARANGLDEDAREIRRSTYESR